jgi:lysophospholipase L1-like esterase
MKKIVSKNYFLLLFFSLFYLSIQAQQNDTICIDFGTDTKLSGNNWNNLTTARAGSISDMITLQGDNTGINLAVSKAFSSVNTSGTEAEASTGILTSASEDSFYGKNGTTPCEITISGLDVSTPYSFEIFGGRGGVTDNRTTQFTVIGSTTEVDSVNTSNNTSELAKVADILPKNDGTITISVEAAASNINPSGYFYLGALKLIYHDADASDERVTTVVSPNGGESWQVGGTAAIKWESNNVSTVDIDYSADNGSTWFSVATDVTASLNTYDWTVPDNVTDEMLVRVLDSEEPTIADTSDAVASIIEIVDNDTICIDFGTSSNPSANNWNNVTGAVAGAISDMITLQGDNTAINLAVTKAFSAVNTSGTEAEASTGILTSASEDSFYGENSRTPCEIIITGLDVSTPYSFEIFGGRGGVSDNRTTQFTVIGSTTEIESLNTSNNTSELAKISDILPKNDGTITISVEAAASNINPSGYFYLGALKLIYHDADASDERVTTVVSPNGGESWQVGGTAAIKWESNNVSTVDIDYSADNGSTWFSVATDVTASLNTYDWTVPDNVTDEMLVRVLDSEEPTIADTSDAVASIIPNDGKSYHIVVLGSSTAAGGGATIKDSAWVWMYTDYLESMYTNFSLTNLAVSGYTTRKILPDGYPTAATTNNITYALSLNPQAIIINLPSNDAAYGISVTDQLSNYDTIASLAVEAGVPLWVTTPQPRNFSSNSDGIQLEMVDSTMAIFGDKAIDLWTGFYEEDGTWDIKDIYDSGDGVHQNNAGHKEMFYRIIGQKIDKYLLGIDPVFKLTVNSGTGSGEYYEGEEVAVTADAPEEGKLFSEWIGDIEYLDDAGSASTTISMSAADITVTATFKLIATGIKDDRAEVLKVYPNPAVNTITFSNIESYSTITVLSMSGQVMDSFSNTSRELSCDVSSYKAGFYIVKMENKEGVKSFTFVKK